MYATGQVLSWCKSARLVNENWKCDLLSMRAVQTLSREKSPALWHCPIPCPLTLIKAEYFSADSQRQMDFVNSSRDRGGYMKSIAASRGGWGAEHGFGVWGGPSEELHITPCSAGMELGSWVPRGRRVIRGPGWAMLLIRVCNNEPCCRSLPHSCPPSEALQLLKGQERDLEPTATRNQTPPNKHRAQKPSVNPLPLLKSS